MGQKKKIKTSDPESLKNAGNKAFQINKFHEAIEFYNQAIEINPKNHIYYANRANALLQISRYDECISDCDQCITLENSFIKCYVRKAKAQMCKQQYDNAISTIQKGFQVENNNEDLNSIIKLIQHEIQLDNQLPTNHSEKTNFKIFHDSMIERGLIMNKIKIRWENEYIRYAVATEDIQKGELLLGVPHTDWITLEQIVSDNTSPICTKLNQYADLTEKLSWPWRNSFFAIFVAEQNRLGDKSQFAHYMKSFPQDVSNFPAMFGEEQRNMLKGSQLYNKIEFTDEVLRSDYDAMCSFESSLADPESGITFEEFKKGKLLVASRAYDIVYTDGNPRQVLIPYCDVALINYGQEQNCTTMQRDNYLKLVSSKQIKRNEILVLSQNIACNSVVIQNSGFLAKHNDHYDTVQLDIGLDSNDPLLGAKLQLINTKQLNQVHTVRRSIIYRSTYEMISWLRFVCFDETEPQAFLVLAKDQAIREAYNKIKDDPELAKKFKVDDIFKGRSISAISIQNERQVLNKLASICLDHLLKFPTTLKQDQEIIDQDIEDPKLTFTEKNLIQLRMGEKSILHHFIQTTQLILPLFTDEMTLKEAKAECEKITDANIIQYLELSLIPFLHEKQSQTTNTESNLQNLINQSQPQKHV